VVPPDRRTPGGGRSDGDPALLENLDALEVLTICHDDFLTGTGPVDTILNASIRFVA
jgi:hypothetical protein